MHHAQDRGRADGFRRLLAVAAASALATGAASFMFICPAGTDTSTVTSSDHTRCLEVLGRAQGEAASLRLMLKYDAAEPSGVK